MAGSCVGTERKQAVVTMAGSMVLPGIEPSNLVMLTNLPSEQPVIFTKTDVQPTVDFEVGLSMVVN